MDKRKELGIFLDNPARILAELYELGGRSNIRKLFEKISKEYGSSFSALYNSLNILEKEGYVIVIENKREKIIQLTEKGKEKGRVFFNFLMEAETQTGEVVGND